MQRATRSMLSSPAQDKRDRGADIMINWGQSLDDDGNRFAAIKPAELINARLTPRHITFIQSLRLPSSVSVTARCTFRDVVEGLPLFTDGTGVSQDWVEGLLAFVPDYGHDTTDIGEHGVNAIAEHYKGHAAPLLALLVLMHCSDYWERQMVNLLGKKSVADHVIDDDFKLNMVIGDPLSTTDEQASIFTDTDLFLARAELLGTHHLFPITDSRFHDLKDLLGCMDVMVHAAADADPDLKRLIGNYDAWAAEN